MPDSGPALHPAALGVTAGQFYIPATASLQERRPRILKHGDTFGLFDHYGDIIPGADSPDGVYHQDTRFVSGLQILLDSQRPLLLSSTVQDDNATLTADLTNIDFYDEAGRLRLKRDTIHILRTKFIWDSRVFERLAVHNLDDKEHRIQLSLRFDCDFVDLFEVRGQRRAARGDTMSHRHGRRAVVFTYRGLRGTNRRATIDFAPDPSVLDLTQATFDLPLKPRERTSVFITISCNRGGAAEPRPHLFFIGLRDARRALRSAKARSAAIETSNDILNEILRRSVADLSMLVTDTPDGPYPYAGIPWFSTAFGRDGIITAIHLLWADPMIARGVLRYLAATQAKTFRPDADAEPGKILHESRQGEMALLGEVPFRQYYGTIDATPLFVMLSGLYFERTGDMATLRELWPSIEAALAWIDSSGDRDGDGFVEYLRRTEQGLSNQGWKDSEDSVFHADGRLAEGAIALCEVQGYVYAAKHQAARIAAALGFNDRSESLTEEAHTLQRRFEAAFWCEPLGTYAIALDGDKRPCEVRTSNAGQVLFSGIAAPERAARISNLLLDQTFFSGWGIRTVASSEPRYNPMSYHNGSIWPHDNALIAIGFARYGLTQHAMRVFSGIFDAGSYMDLRRLPELFCGFRRLPGKGPTLYPVACAPQAWASAAPFAFLQACIGLEFEPDLEEIRFRHPVLPEFLDWVVLRGLRIGASRFEIMLRRYGNEVAVNVIARVGKGSVAITL
jgi:glycogen debranching enzyme